MDSLHTHSIGGVHRLVVVVVGWDVMTRVGAVSSFRSSREASKYSSPTGSPRSVRTSYSTAGLHSPPLTARTNYEELDDDEPSAAAAVTPLEASTSGLAEASLQPMYTLRHVDPPLPVVPAASGPSEWELEEAESAVRREAAYVARLQQWTHRWDGLRAALHERLARPQHEVSKAAIALEVARDQSTFQRQQSAHTDEWRARIATHRDEVRQRRAECRAMDREATREAIFTEYNARRLQAHYASVTEHVLATEVAESESHALHLRESLHQSTRRMFAEREQRALDEESGRLRAIERAAAELARHRAEEAARARQAQQERILRVRTGVAPNNRRRIG